MRRDVSVSLLVSLVLSNVVKVVSSDDDGVLHLGRGHHSSDDSTSDTDVTGERTFLIDIGSAYGIIGDVEP